MGRHIVITVYFADEGYQRTLASPEVEEQCNYHLERPFYRQSHQEMEKRHDEAMEEIDLYLRVWNDCEVYTTEDIHFSQCMITLPKKADLDAGMFSLVYHLFQRGYITGFTVMHTGA